jgi:hypothetical protein
MYRCSRASRVLRSVACQVGTSVRATQNRVEASIKKTIAKRTTGNADTRPW